MQPIKSCFHELWSDAAAKSFRNRLYLRFQLPFVLKVDCIAHSTRIKCYFILCGFVAIQTP